MTTEALMQTCAELGIKLSLREDDDSRLLVDAPKGALTASLRDALAAHKPDLIAAIKKSTARASQAHETATPIPARISPNSPEATPLILEQSLTNPPLQSRQTEVEVSKLLSGSDFDESVVNSSDVVSRQTVSTQ